MFIKGLARVNAGGGDAAKTLSDLGLKGTQNAQVLLRMTGAGDLLTRSIDLGNRAWEDNTALLNEANKRYATTESTLKTARNQINDFAIDIGANVLPALAGLADHTGALVSWFGALPGPVKDSVTTLGGMVTVIGLVGGATLLAIPKLQAMNATLAQTGPRGAAAAAGLSRFGSALLGPWGIALLGATVALGVWSDHQAQAKQRAEALADTLDKQTGALTASSRALVRDTLFDDEVLESAQRLGLNLRDVVDAALGLPGPLAKVNAALDEQNRAQLALGSTGQGLAGTARILATDLDKVHGAIAGGNKDIERAREEYKLKAAAMGDDAQATDAATAATDAFSTAQQQAAVDTSDAAKELEDLIRSVEDYGDTVNGALDATSDYEAAIDDATAALKENGKTANKSKTAIDLHTKAGRDNDKALRAIATSALKAATANFENGRSVKSVTGDVVKARAEFITMATKMGLSRTAAEKLATQLGLTKGNVDTLSDAVRKTPTSHTTDMRVETKAALAKLTAFQQRINGLRGNDVRVGVRYVDLNKNPTSKAGGQVKNEARGDIIDYAGGGFHHPSLGAQQPQIRAAGGDGIRWAEKGAGPWEAFISGNPANRDRSEAIWWDTGRRLGTVGTAATQQQQVFHDNRQRILNVTANGLDAKAVAKEIRREQAKDDAFNPEFGG